MKIQLLLLSIFICTAASLKAQTTFKYKVTFKEETKIKTLKSKEQLKTITFQKGDSISWEIKYQLNGQTRIIHRDSVIKDESPKSITVKSKIMEEGTLSIKPKIVFAVKQVADTLFYDFWPLKVNKDNVGNFIPKNILKDTFGIPDLSTLKEKELREKIKRDDLIKFDSRLTRDKYYTVLTPRTLYNFKFVNGEVGLFTSPFKFRANTKGYNLKNRLTKSFNANLYAGVSWGTVKYTYRKLEEVGPFKRFWNAGAFIGFDVLTVDSTESKYLTEKNYGSRELGYFSIGTFIGYSFSDIKFGVSMGVDLGVGEAAIKSAYNNSFWIGFGLGYKLSFIKNPS
jgi:hypothetical protein